MFSPFGFNPPNQEGQNQNGKNTKENQKNEIEQQQFQQFNQFSNSFFPQYQIPQFQTLQQAQIGQNAQFYQLQIPFQQYQPMIFPQFPTNFTYQFSNFQGKPFAFNQQITQQNDIPQYFESFQAQTSQKTEKQSINQQQQNTTFLPNSYPHDQSNSILINQTQQINQNKSIYNQQETKTQNYNQSIQQNEPTKESPKEETFYQYPNKSQPQLEIPKEEEKPYKFVKREKQTTDIFVPEFREITEKENPLLWDNIQPGATDLATVFIIEAHQQLEEIEDMVKLGYEKGVDGPGSLLRRYNEHPFYGIDRGEATKLAHYEAKREKTYVLPNWPKRVYDSESSTTMTKKLQNEYKESYEEWKEDVQDRIEKAKGLHRDVPTTTKRRRKARKMSEMITESTDDETDTDDFYLSR